MKSSACDIGLSGHVDWEMSYVHTEDVTRLRAAGTGKHNCEGRGGGRICVVALSGMDAIALLALVIDTFLCEAGRHDKIFRSMKWCPMMASLAPDGTAKCVTIMGTGKENDSVAGVTSNKGMKNHQHQTMAFGSYSSIFGREELTHGRSDLQLERTEKVRDEEIGTMQSQHDEGHI